MPPRLAITGLAVLSLVTLAHGAQAAGDIPGGPTTKATLPITTEPTYGDWHVVGDSDWYRIALQKGQAYAFFLNKRGDADGFTLRLRDPAGKSIRQYPGYYDTSAGFEFVAPTSGTYFLDAKLEGFDGGADGGYVIEAGPDCAGGVKTTCAYKLGTTQQRAILFEGDVDWFKVQLQAGRAYTFTGVDPTGFLIELEVDVVDAAGKVLGKSERGESADIVRLTNLKVPKSGTYYLQVKDATDEGKGEYRLSGK